VDNNKEHKQYLALDVGLKRTGIARGSEAARLAEPLMTVPTTEVLKTMQGLIEEYNVSAVVVGLPRNLHGNNTQQTNWVRDWVDQVKKKINLPFYWQDEVLSSKIAAAKKLSYKKVHDVDSLAAAIILQDFLDTPEAGRIIS
jgi:putative holliday junction resolvase